MNGIFAIVKLTLENNLFGHGTLRRLRSWLDSQFIDGEERER